MVENNTFSENNTLIGLTDLLPPITHNSDDELNSIKSFKPQDKWLTQVNSAAATQKERPQSILVKRSQGVSVKSNQGASAQPAYNLDRTEKNVSFNEQAQQFAIEGDSSV